MQTLTDPKAIELAEYMQAEFGVTPENIDEKLEVLRKEYYKKILKTDVGKVEPI